MSNIDKQALRQLAVDAKELAIIKRYTKGIEAQKKFIAVMTPATVLALLDDLEAKDKQIADLKEAFRIALSAAGIDAPAAAGKGE
ncbi:ead/Ea22-like family protein [Enterobacter hormaechei]|uniref:ead/Ea22-like family protein n=1 Tax=Enterobacter hormaechei TaxID=158836 RepID=UPI00388D7892